MKRKNKGAMEEVHDNVQSSKQIVNGRVLHRNFGNMTL